jgi:hypothetical protein
VPNLLQSLFLQAVHLAVAEVAKVTLHLTVLVVAVAALQPTAVLGTTG